MNCDQIKKGVTAFLNNELSQAEKKLVAEHLMKCEECRRAHDDERTGVLLAAQLPSIDAPEAVWAKIADSIEQRPGFQLGMIPESPWFGIRKGIAFATAVAIVSLVSALVYLGLFSDNVRQIAVVQIDQSDLGEPAQDVEPFANANVPEAAIDSSTQPGTNTNSNANGGNANLPVTPPNSPSSWEVETIAGAPTVAGGGAEKLAVGQMLETDARSRARIAVADIGTVDVSPNSRVRLAGTGTNEHRLALERGHLHAKIFAPPRLFVVDTPSAKAVDLGCEYTLEVDDHGNSVLKVTGGWVALERGGRESIVPAGMMCKTRKGIGLGTPFSPDATENFKKALDNFDFSGGRGTSVQILIREAEFYDMFTLWHLLSRVGKQDRGLVFDTLAGFVTPPAGVTRDGVIALNKQMLEAWKAEVENAWFN